MKTVRTLTAIGLLILTITLSGCVLTSKNVQPTDEAYFTFTEKNNGYSISLSDDADIIADLPENVILPSSYNGKPVIEVAQTGFYSSSIKSVKIPKSVISIGSAAFSSCPSLKKVELSSGLTTIGDYAFYGNNLLTKCELPDSLVTIGKSAFQRSGLADVDLRENVVTVGDNAFNGCGNLASVYVGMNVKTIGADAFLDCNPNLTFIVSDLNEVYKVYEGQLVFK